MADIKNAPTTPLPWKGTFPFDRRRGHRVLSYIKLGGACLTICRSIGEGTLEDIRYIVHAANSYPRQVEFARWVVDQDPQRLTDTGKHAYALLVSLGETNT